MAGGPSSGTSAGSLTETLALIRTRRVQTALFAVTFVCAWFGYNPPKRSSAVDGLPLSEKLKRLDMPGTALLTGGLTLLLVGLGFGGAPYAWSAAIVVAPIVVGIVGLLSFGVWEWKGTVRCSPR